MEDLNWKEFQQLVPTKIKAVILTVGPPEKVCSRIMRRFAL
jgi:hypothetical protein